MLCFMRKTLFPLFLFLSFCSNLSAQQKGSEGCFEKSLFERIAHLENRSRRFNLLLNMQGGFDVEGNSPALGASKNHARFNMRQLRIEAKGDINERFSFRWRQRLNGSKNPGVDNLPASIDVAGLGIKLDKRFSLFVGRQFASFGGFEYDLNPIDVYEFSDMSEYIGCFLTGISLTYQPVSAHQFHFQILNALNDRFSETYRVQYDPSLRPSKLPLLYTVNWNGSMYGGLLQTRWSASLSSQTSQNKIYYIALGNSVNIGSRFGLFFDLMYSREGLDSKGILSDLISSVSADSSWPVTRYTVKNTEYLSFVSKANVRFASRWNWFVQGMYETASVYKESIVKRKIDAGKYRTALGYLTGIEYYPMSGSNLHFFLTYVGRSYKFDEKRSLSPDYTTNRLSLGFIYQLPMF